METTEDQNKGLPRPLALGKEPHPAYLPFFEIAELPKAQRRILKRRDHTAPTPARLPDALAFFRSKVAGKENKTAPLHYVWDAAPLLLVGPAGKGKTGAACDIADRVMRMGMRVFYSDAHEMHRRYRHPALEIDTFETQFLTSRLLVLDNFENLMPSQEGDLMSWVKRRTDDLRWTILIADLADQVPVSSNVIEYFSGKGKVIHCK